MAQVTAATEHHRYQGIDRVVTSVAGGIVNVAAIAEFPRYSRLYRRANRVRLQ
jgi:hypothetical protein